MKKDTIKLNNDELYNAENAPNKDNNGNTKFKCIEINK